MIEIIKDEVEITGCLPMVSARSEIDVRLFKKISGKSGKIWLVSAVDPDCASFIYVGQTPEFYTEKGERRPEGFGGSILEFKLENGSTVKLAGPWHSNCESLFEDTGFDIRDKHLTWGVIAIEREWGENGSLTYRKVLHVDDDWVMGRFQRIELLAREFARKLDQSVYCYSRTHGGSSSSMIKPDHKFWFEK